MVGTHACATAGSAQQCVSFEPISGSPVLVALRQSYHELGFVSSMRPSVESSFCKGDEKDALLGGASSGTRHTGRAREHRPKKVWTPGLPSGWRGRFLIVKKGVGLGPRHSEPRRRGTTPTYDTTRRVVRSTLPPSPARPIAAAFPTRLATVQRACLARTRAINGGQGQNARPKPLARREPRKTRDEPRRPAQPK